MQFGVCTDLSKAGLLADIGFDFIEGTVSRDLINYADDAAFADFCKQAKQAAIPMQAANGFIPGNLKIVGPDADMRALHDYAAKVMQRAEQAGLETIVFGSGSARQIPQGFDEAEAWQQIVAFTHAVAAEASEHGVTVVVEPLRSGDCNFITNVGQGAKLVREVNHASVRLLVDSYHWACDEDSAEEIVTNAYLLHHVHVATPAHRLPPGGEDYDWSTFYTALKKGNYEGRVSIEAKWTDLAAQAADAFKAIRIHAGL